MKQIGRFIQGQHERIIVINYSLELTKLESTHNPFYKCYTVN